MTTPSDLSQMVYSDEVIWWDSGSAAKTRHLAEYPFVEGIFVVKVVSDTSGVSTYPTHGPHATVEEAAAVLMILNRLMP